MTPGPIEVTHTTSKKGTGSQTPHRGYRKRGNTYMTEKRPKIKRKKIDKPNSGNTSKITQYFSLEKPTDRGIGEGRVKGKAGGRVN